MSYGASNRRALTMYINSGYLHNSHIDFKDKTKPLIVGSCGTTYTNIRSCQLTGLAED